jgi:predicted MFS family arabinose efflux permease
MGSFIGSLLGGWLADEVGYNAINWMGAVAAGSAVALLIIVIGPMNKSRYGDEQSEADPVGSDV